MASQGEACRGCATADVLRQRVLDLEAKNADLESRIASATAQCDNMVFNCEKSSTDNAQHLRSWRSLRGFLMRQQ